MDPDRELIDEQIAYYRARAPEYDATSTPDGDPFAPDADAIRASVRALAPLGRVLELAAGTGQWTELLVELADELLVTDTSPEMLALNRARIGQPPNVRHELADSFDLEPSHAFDTVFFGNFLSHVPVGRFEAFWSRVAGVLAPGGRCVFVDEGVHFEWREDWIDETAGIVRRPLADGSVRRAIKVLWRPDDLARRLEEVGWTASVTQSGPFYWGVATSGATLNIT
jgi:demethylmenaquinone methyltransferase/2-methoxy-6-polyprenyl-1,4-benzoquinol methylase